jgi:hypothetical protein
MDYSLNQITEQSNQFMNDIITAGPVPETGVCYWVQCENFRCMGFFDEDGKWKSASNGRELPDVISFFPKE